MVASNPVLASNPILLPGFDGTAQLEHSFKSSTFESVWLQRLYTDESNHVLTRSDRRKVQEIKFGNNITVLLKACFHLRDTYHTPFFWAAVTTGFKSMNVDLALETASCFIAARRIFRHNEVGRRFISATTVAADAWLGFLDSQTVQRLPEVPPALGLPLGPAGVRLRTTAAEFFSGIAKSPMVDSARITFKDEEPGAHSHISAHAASSVGSRKRSPSFNPPSQPPIAKRRSIAGLPDKPAAMRHPQARAPPSLPPLATSLNTISYAKQDPYQTPSTAQDGLASDGYFPQGTSDDQSGIKIRGQAHVQLQSPSTSVLDATTEERSASYGELRQAHIRLQIRVEVLERDKKQSEAVIRSMDAKFAELEKRMKASEAQSARHDEKIIEHIKNNAVSTESQLRKAQERLVNESETFRNMEKKVRSVEKELESMAQLSDSTEAFQALQKMVQMLEMRMGTMESMAFRKSQTPEEIRDIHESFDLQAVLVDRVREALHEIQADKLSQERLAVTEAETQHDQLLKEMASRLTAVETKITEGDDSCRSLETRTTTLGARAGVNISTLGDVRDKVMVMDDELKAELAAIRKLESQVSTITQQQQEMANAPVDNASQTALAKRLDRQVASLRTDSSSSRGQQELDDKLKQLEVKIVTLQASMTAVRHTINDLTSKKTPPPVINDLLKKVQGLPTREFISEKVAQSAAQMEQNMKNTVEKCRAEITKQFEGRIRDIKAGTDQTTRIDEIAIALKEVKATMQSTPHKIRVLEGKLNIMTTNLDIANQNKPREATPAVLAGRVDRILQRVQRIEEAQEAQSSVDTPEALRELDHLSQTVKGILDEEERLNVSINIDVLLQRVESLENALRGLTNALTGNRP